MTAEKGIQDDQKRESAIITRYPSPRSLLRVYSVHTNNTSVKYKQNATVTVINKEETKIKYYIFNTTNALVNVQYLLHYCYFIINKE